MSGSTPSHPRATGDATTALEIGGRDYLDAVGIAALAGLSRAAVLRLARLGRVPYYQLGRRWFFNPEEFIQALRRGPGSSWAGMRNASTIALPRRRTTR